MNNGKERNTLLRFPKNKAGTNKSLPEKPCSDTIQKIIKGAENRIFIVLNKRCPFESEAYEDEATLEVLSSAIKSGISVYVIFSQFNTLNDVYSHKLFKTLKKDSELDYLVECSVVLVNNPGIGTEHPSFIFSDNTGSRIKNVLGFTSSHFKEMKDNDFWIEFLVHLFRMMKPISERIHLN